MEPEPSQNETPFLSPPLDDQNEHGIVYLRTPPTFQDSLFSGSLAAMTETLTLHWTTASRFRSQLKSPPTKNIFVLYRSLFPDLISMVPITVAQIFFDSLLRQGMGGGDRGLTTLERMLAAAGAGVIASPFPSYAEMLMLNQQKYGMGMIESVCWKWKQSGLKGIFCGLPICAIRDSIYTSAYLGFAPWLNEKCHTKFSQIPWLSTHNHWLPFVIAGPTGGLAAGVITQPLDCIKSRQQASTTKMSALQAFEDILKKEGYHGFFSGMTGRLQRVSVGVVVMSFINDKVQRRLQNRRYNELVRHY